AMPLTAGAAQRTARRASTRQTPRWRRRPAPGGRPPRMAHDPDKAGGPYHRGRPRRGRAERLCRAYGAYRGLASPPSGGEDRRAAALRRRPFPPRQSAVGRPASGQGRAGRRRLLLLRAERRAASVRSYILLYPPSFGGLRRAAPRAAPAAA